MRKPVTAKRGMTFVRYGGLSPVKQHGFTNDSSKKTYHSPPARKGVYAFPEFWVEHFLLGGDLSTYGVRSRIVILKDKHGTRITNRHPGFDEYIKRGDKYWDRTNGKLWPDAQPDEDGNYEWTDYIHYITVQQKPRKFVYDGPLWHHLGEYVKEGPILKKNGNWVFTSMDIYKKAFKNEMKSRRKQAIRYLSGWMGDSAPPDAAFIGRNPYDWVSKDHLEVFIERIK
jgi:hypothetical protein